MTGYIKPLVWKWEDKNDNRSGNRPTAGSRFEQKLPKGEKPFQVYSLGTPNGIKVAIKITMSMIANPPIIPYPKYFDFSSIFYHFLKIINYFLYYN